MFFMDWIIQRLNDASDLFYDIYREVWDWVWPFWLAAEFFWELSWLFWRLAQDCIRFNSWLSWADIRLEGIFSLWEIWEYFEKWFNWGMWAWDWVADAFLNVWNIVDDWWSSTQSTVRAWIDEAKSYAASLVANLNLMLSSLQSAWDDFKGMIPTIDEVIYWWRNWPGNVLTIVSTWWTSTMGEVQGLIDSSFIEREPFWAGWQELKDKVAEFFTDPLEFLWARFTDWFLGPEV